MEEANIINIKSKERIFSYDLIRSMAIICVILCHCIEAVYLMNLEEYNLLSLQSRIFKSVFFTIGRFGVPLFLFLSGALLLKKQIENDEDVIKFYKKNLLPILITTEIWIVIYNIFLCFYHKLKFNLMDLVCEMLFLKQVPFNNMWYMPMIIGIYIAIPFIACIVKKFSAKSIFIGFIISFIYTSVLQTINVFLTMFKLPNIYSIIDLNWLGGIYGIYILIGYALSKELLKKLKTYQCVGMSIIFTAIVVGCQIISYNKGVPFDVWYNFLFLIIAATFLFETICRIKIKNKIIMKIIESISKYSLAIFFLHVIVIEVVKKIIIAIDVMMPVKVVILLIITVMLCCIIILIFSKIKLVKEKIFLIKD